METFSNWLLQPWPWYVAGPMIGLTVPTLLYLTGRTLGISSTFRHVCAVCMPNSRFDYIRTDNWRRDGWNIMLAIGVILGGFLATNFLSAEPVRLLPPEYYSLQGAIRLLIGGMLVGFGTRYANGCTSGHTISGISDLQLVSVVASIFFFVGGLFMTYVIMNFLIQPIPWDTVAIFDAVTTFFQGLLT